MIGFRSQQLPNPRLQFSNHKEIVRHVQHDKKTPIAPQSIIVFCILLHSFTSVFKVDKLRIIQCKANIDPTGKVVIRYRWVIPKAGDAARENYEVLQRFWDLLQTFSMLANNPSCPV